MSEPKDYSAALEVRGEGSRVDWGRIVAAVGDINSPEKGSGARYNQGKPKMEYIPVHVWWDWLESYEEHWEGDSAGDLVSERLEQWYDAVMDLAEFQAGRKDILEVLGFLDSEHMRQATAVFDYGAKKYAAWNWAKGMAWSIPIACIMRHLEAYLRGEDNDPESGLPHTGHIACNFIMLAHFVRYYPDGDDRPPKECF